MIYDINYRIKKQRDQQQQQPQQQSVRIEDD